MLFSLIYRNFERPLFHINIYMLFTNANNMTVLSPHLLCPNSTIKLETEGSERDMSLAMFYTDFHSQL